jgi:uncharacterized linocin/CFP29 family protein
MTDHLLRDLAPISDAGWEAVEGDVKPRLAEYLAARKLVDFEGPHGWTYSAVNLGRTTSVAGFADGLDARQRSVQPVVEVRAPFTVSRDELDAADRGAPDPDFPELETAARAIAVGENVAVFHGQSGAGIRGITEASSHDAIELPGDAEQYPTAVARAVKSLREAGVSGPYGLAIAPDVHTRIIETTEHGGYLLLDHLRRILEGPVVWAPGVQCGVVLSLRGGDFVLEVGEDLSIGYLAHDAASVQLYLEESFTFRVVEPDAAVALHIAG